MAGATGQKKADTRDSHSLYLFFFLTLILFVGAAFKGFFKNEMVKTVWSYAAFGVAVVGAGIFISRLLKSNRAPYKKVIDIALCAVMLFFMSDLVFEFTFLTVIRPWFANPLTIVLFGFFFMAYYKVFPDFAAGKEFAEEQKKARAQLMAEYKQKSKDKKDK